MTGTLTTSAPTVLQEYYRVLTAGPDAFGAGQGLRALLSSHLDFTGSLAGHHTDATDGFLHGVAGFISTVPGGTVRFAEFFTFRDGVIDTLNLHYDGQDDIAKGGR